MPRVGTGRRAEAEAGPGGGAAVGRGAQRDVDNAFGDAFGAEPPPRDAKRARVAQR